MNAQTLDTCWKYFDRFYCISINERTDRRAAAKVQFEKVGLADKVEFVIVNKHPHNCEEGIYESHMACLKKGLQAGADNMVIFEDDILFDRFNRANIENCVDFLEGIKQWDAFFFGCLVSDSKKTQSKSVIKIKYRCLAHAYAVNRRFAESLIKTQWQGEPYDEVLKKCHDRYYAAYPAFAFQSNSPTDNIRNLDLDKFRRMFGGLKRIQKWNEFYYRHKIPVIAAHAILLLIAVVGVWYLVFGV